MPFEPLDDFVESFSARYGPKTVLLVSETVTVFSPVFFSQAPVLGFSKSPMSVEVQKLTSTVSEAQK